MIARMWRGWAPLDKAQDYQRHYESEVAAQLTLGHGFRGARLLRHRDGDEIQFTSIAFFTSMQAVRVFAGKHPERAVVDDLARELLSHWDAEVTHHEVVADF
ncbi:hypothetical protein [Nocardia sp. NPDC051832]|uniref:hypothetical protein n=1 Tax=Nocardia sp. NPDC051832 TaxID=3155673 RepID=UPI00341F16B0